MRFHSFVFFLFVTTITFGQSDVEIAGDLFNSYLLAREKGNIYESYQILNHILESDYNLPDYNIAVLYSNLGVAAKNLGLYEQAKENYKLALAYCKMNSIQEKTLYFDILINQGVLCRHIGEYLLANEYYEETERLLSEEANFTLGFQERSSLLKLNKALVLYDQENYTEALKLLFESKIIKEAYDLTHLGSVYFNVARTYQALKNSPQADKYYKASVERWKLEHGSSYYQLGNVYRDYGQFLIESKDHDMGLSYYNQAIENYLFNYGSNHAYISDCYYHIAQFYIESEDYKEALNFLQDALISICPDFYNTNIFSNPVDLKPLLDIRLLKTYNSKLVALNGLANSNNLRTKAIEILEVALKTADEAFYVLTRIQNSYLTRESRLFLIGNQRDFFVHGIDVALQLFEYTGLLYYKEKAYGFASLSKTLELNFEIKEKNWMYMSSMEEDSVNNLLSMYEQIFSLTNLIYEGEVNQESNSVQVDQMKHELFTLRRSFENIHQRIFGNRFDSLAETKHNHNPLVDLQSRLSKKQTVIEFSLGEKDPDKGQKIYTFLITKDSCRISQSIVDNNFTNQIYNVFNSSSSINTVKSKGNTDKQLISWLHGLYIALFHPIEDWVRTRNLTIIPDGELILIPFDLLVRDIDSLKSYSDQNYLLYDYAIGYAPNSTMINKPDRAILRRPPNIVAIAPDFNESDNGNLSIINSSMEIEEILKEFKGEKIIDIHSNDSLAKASKGKILHFATHSVADSEITGNPYLILGIEKNSTFRKLFDFEICNLSIESPMVVVNSCESGKGPFYEGEGMLSISRSFLLAGASSVIHTLWPIEDISSSRIMIDYYHLLSKGLNKTEALRKAKIKYLESTPNSFTHPHFWAGFQVIGDPNPIVHHRRTIQIILGILAILTFIAVIRRVRVKYWPE